MATNIVFFIFLVFHLSHAKVLDLSCSQIRIFVDGHNNNRFRLAKGEVPKQPPASEMKYMIWDKELAAKASQWASNNKFAHNPDRTIGSKRFTTGENIFMSFSTDLNYKLDIPGALRSWFDEYKHYTYGPLKASDFTGSGEAIGHYTQMVWSNSIYLGCGVSQNINKGRMEYLVVCNYGPTFDEASVYQAVDRVNGKFGGLRPHFNDTINIHGRVDSWHPLGVHDRDLKPSSPTITVPRASHYFDMSKWQVTNTIRMTNAQ